MSSACLLAALRRAGPLGGSPLAGSRLVTACPRGPAGCPRGSAGCIGCDRRHLYGRRGRGPGAWSMTVGRLNGGRRQPVAHIELGGDVPRIPGPNAELDVSVPDRLAAFDTDDLAHDVVPGLAVVQCDRRAAPVVEPLVPPGQHGRENGEEVAAHFGQQVLVAWRV